MIKETKVEERELSDFTERLFYYLESLNLTMPINVGLLDKEDSIALASARGGQTIRSYFNGRKDKQFTYMISIKTKGNQKLAHDTLNRIADELERVEDIPSLNESYAFLGIQIVEEPFFRGEDVKGYFWYQMELKVDLAN